MPKALKRSYRSCMVMQAACERENDIATAVVSMKSRKVSFDDCNENDDSSSSAGNSSHQECPRKLQSSPSMRRRTSSTCLAAMANQEDDSSLQGNFAVSEPLSTNANSKWGQFVDVIPHDSDDDSATIRLPSAPKTPEQIIDFSFSFGWMPYTVRGGSRLFKRRQRSRSNNRRVKPVTFSVFQQSTHGLTGVGVEGAFANLHV